MGKHLPYFKLYTSDFERATRAMSLEEVGGYTRMLVAEYDRDQPLPYDLEVLRRVLGVYRLSDAKRHIDRLIELGKFVVGPDGCLHNGRADQEMEIRRTIGPKSKDNRSIVDNYQTDNQPDLPLKSPKSEAKSTDEPTSALAHPPASAFPRHSSDIRRGQPARPEAGAGPASQVSALPPRKAQSVAPPADGAPLPPSPAQVEPTADQMTAEQLAAAGERIKQLIAKSFQPMPQHDIPAYQHKPWEIADAQTDTTAPAEPGGHRMGEGELPQPERAPPDHPSPPEPAEGQGGDRTAPEPDQPQRAPDESDLSWALRKARTP